MTLSIVSEEDIEFLQEQIIPFVSLMATKNHRNLETKFLFASQFSNTRRSHNSCCLLLSDTLKIQVASVKSRVERLTAQASQIPEAETAAITQQLDDLNTWTRRLIELPDSAPGGWAQTVQKRKAKK